MAESDGVDAVVQLQDGSIVGFQAKLGRELPNLSIDKRRELAVALERLAAALRPDQIYVFGSYARRTAIHPASDVDVLLVLPESAEPSYRRAQQAYAAVGPHELGLDILVLTRDEFTSRSSADWSVQADIARDGRLLYAA